MIQTRGTTGSGVSLRALLLPLAALAAAAGHLLLQANLDQSFVDGTYRQDLYPLLLRCWRVPGDLVPWSISGLLLLFIVLLTSFRLLRLLAGCTRPGFFLRLLGAGLRALAWISLLVHPFLLFWGYHYRGTPLAARLAIEERSTTARIELLASLACTRTSALRPLVLRAQEPPPPVAREVERGLAALGLPHPELPRAVKFPPIAGMLAAQGVTGTISPFTLEAHVESDLHWAQRPFVTAHELAHLAGITGEREANFIAWFSLATSSHPHHRYAAWLGLVPYLPARELQQEVRQDLREIQARRRQRRVPLVSELQQLLYGAYLRSQGVAAGGADYRGVRALAANWFALHPGTLAR